MTDAPVAQITYTTNAFTSPEVIGAIATMAAIGLVKLGAPSLDQPVLITVIGMVLTGIAHWMWPGASGRLGLTAPMAGSVPPPQPVFTSGIAPLTATKV